MMLSRSLSSHWFRSVVGVAATGAALVAGGCGSATTTTQTSGNTAPASAVAASATRDVNEATTIVGQFLDAVRRGGEGNRANELLTKNAQAVLQRLGRTVQPIGSPDAVFTVTRAESLPDTPGAALVHSTWTEPTGDGKSESYQVVWALESEASGWRISGLAMDLEPGKDPMIVDFENGSQMATLLNSADEPPAAVVADGSGGMSQAPPVTQPVQR